MARKLVPVTVISHYGLTPVTADTFTTVPNGWLVPNDGATFLYFDNTAVGVTSNVTVLLTAGADVNLTTGPRPYPIPASTGQFTGFFPVRNYGSQLLISTDNAGLGIAAYSMSYAGQQDSFN